VAPPRIGSELAADRAARMRRDAARYRRGVAARRAARGAAGGVTGRAVGPAVRRARALAATMLSALRV